MVGMTIDAEEQRIIKERTRKPLLYAGIVGISMVFAGLTSAYIVRQADADWLEFELPNAFYVSTLLIVLSSIAMYFATFSIKKGNNTGLVIGSGLAFLLGIGFVFAQFHAYDVLVENGFHLTGKDTSVSSSFLYVLTGAHLAHLFGGVIALGVVFIKSVLKRYSKENKLGVELAAIYWHYLDFVWIYLLLFLLFIR